MAYRAAFTSRGVIDGIANSETQVEPRPTVSTEIQRLPEENFKIENLKMVRARSLAAVNFGRSSRMCLCLDFMAEAAFDPCEIFTDSAPQLEYRKELYINRKPFSEEGRDSITTATSRLLSRSTFKDLIFTLSINDWTV